jgi:hypothetical protein
MKTIWLVYENINEKLDAIFETLDEAKKYAESTFVEAEPVRKYITGFKNSIYKLESKEVFENVARAEYARQQKQKQKALNKLTEHEAKLLGLI